MLEGRHFTIITNLLSMHLYRERDNAHLGSTIRWISYRSFLRISDTFPVKIMWPQIRCHGQTISSVPPSSEEIAREQSKDGELKELLTSRKSSLKIQRIAIPGSHLEVYCDVSEPKPRSQVPLSLRQLFNAVNKHRHPGAKSTKKIHRQFTSALFK